MSASAATTRTCVRGTSRPATAPPVLKLAQGVELLGEFKGSGYREAPHLVRRADGQMLQLSRLTYLLLDALAGGANSPEAAATAVCRRTDRPISAAGVQFLVDNKLAPLGLVANGAISIQVPTANPFLALRARATLLTPRVSNAAAVLLRPLFLPVVVAAVIAALAALDFWLFIQHGLQPAVHQVLIDPIVLLAVLGLTLVSAVFHELGHATACRYGGARPGAIGVGLYLIWPSFFTDVTDAYRLGRRGRLRTDLGGIYFNSVFILAVAGIYAATGQEALLLVILLGHLEMIEQLMPFVRFDGYFILSDLAGIPDLFARIGPVLNNALQRGRIADPRIQGLRRSSRLLVTFWTVLTVPLLGLNLGYLVLHLPSIDGALWTSMRIQAATTGRAIAGGMYAAGAIEVIGVALLALSIGGTLYITSGTVVRLARFARRWTSDRARERAVVVALAAVVTTALALVWLGWHEFSGWHV